MANQKSEWDLFLAELPEDLRAMLEEGVTSIELPSKDHPIFEILRQSFGEWFSQMDITEDPNAGSEDDGEETEKVETGETQKDENSGSELSQQVQDCLSLMTVTSQSMTKTHGLMIEASGKIKSDCDNTVVQVERMVSNVKAALTPSVDKLEKCFNEINLWRKWTPWVASGLAAILLSTGLILFGYQRAVDLAYDRADTKFAQMEGVTKTNITTLKELGKIGVTATLVPDIQNEQYFLNLTNVREFTGKSDIPGGKALIFKP